MHPGLKRKLATGAAVVAALAFAGGAYAAAHDSHAAGRKGFIDDVAKRLNVTPAQLTNALQQAFSDRLNAAVAAHRLTQAQANALERRAQQHGWGPGGFAPLGGFGPAARFGPPRPFGPNARFGPAGRFGPPGWRAGPPGAARFAPGPPGLTRLGAAAAYLGLTDARLFSKLRAGQSLAQIALSQGKTPAGLEHAMTARARLLLTRAVAAEKLTSAEEKKLLARISARTAAQVNAKPTFPGPPWRGGRGPGWRRPGAPRP